MRDTISSCERTGGNGPVHEGQRTRPILCMAPVNFDMRESFTPRMLTCMQPRLPQLLSVAAALDDRPVNLDLSAHIRRYIDRVNLSGSIKVAAFSEGYPSSICTTANTPTLRGQPSLPVLAQCAASHEWILSPRRY